ncbi:MAG: lipocalin-like domain-containing protein [Candidatus Thermoplasmatota archaeon]|nr:lipocalin-like domain-containing protein [Candidatus Thermoplasmatota archaeon]
MNVEEKILGCWALESFTFDFYNGNSITPFGESPLGILIYNKCGYMSANLMKPDRVKFASNDQSVATYNELSDSANYIGYAGKYVIHENEIIHHVETSYFPNWVGTSQRRFYSLSDDKLTLSTEPLMNGGVKVVAKLVWNRIL